MTFKRIYSGGTYIHLYSVKVQNSGSGNTKISLTHQRWNRCKTVLNIHKKFEEKFLFLLEFGTVLVFERKNFDSIAFSVSILLSSGF